ncbi:MAG: DNA translocase FtsK 4TM domain-containing protein, partial [Clostridiaceae bacterium]
MSKKNTTKKKTKTVTKTDNNNSPLYDDIKGIILITISILLIISIFTNGSIGIIGTTFKKYIFFILGMASYFFPFLFTFLGIAYIKSQKKLTYNKKFYGMILFVANSNFLISIITLDNYYKNSLFQAIKNLYKSNSIFHGGVISLFIAIPFEKLIGTYGLYIIIFSIYIISLVLILNNSIYEILSNFKQNRKSLKKQDKNTILKEEPINKKEYIKDVNSKIKILDFMKNTPVENIDETYKQISINNYSEDTLPEKDEKEPAIEKMLEKEIEENKENKIISYEFPSTNFLNQNLLSKMNKDDKKGLLKNAAKLEDTLLSFGVEAKVLQVSKGPSVTRYELQPKVGV